MNWRTMFQTPAKNEIVVIAIPPDMIMMAVFDGEKFIDNHGNKKASADEVEYWSPITNPWKEKNERVDENA